METKLTVRNGELPDTIQEKINQKASKLPKFFDRTTGIQIVVDLKHSENPEVEIILSAEETNDFFASATGTNVLASMDSAVQKVEGQLKKHNEKLKGHRGTDNRHSDVN